MTHPQRGAEVLEPLAAFYPDLARGVVAHHERWDGKGYPRGLKGRRIPLEARVVTIADSFDAIMHQRRYSPARSLNAAVDAKAATAPERYEVHWFRFDNTADQRLPVGEPMVVSGGSAQAPQGLMIGDFVGVSVTASPKR